MTTDQTYTCNLMKVDYCWYNAGNQHNSTSNIAKLYENRDKLGLHHYFELTQLHIYGLKSLGYNYYPEDEENIAPCLVCGPKRVPTLNGLGCIKLSMKHRINGCGLYMRNPDDPEKIQCMLCVHHYYLVVQESGNTYCGYNHRKSACIDPNDLDDNGFCKKCDSIRGYWATDVSKDVTGEVIGNKCSYVRKTDQLRHLYWIDFIYFSLAGFLVIFFIFMIVCCCISSMTVRVPKDEREKMKNEIDTLEEDSMVKSFVEKQD